MLIDSYAKINLYLNVLNKRSDGYHEIETLFSTINLHDSLKFALTKKPLIKILSNIPELASESNLVYKIAKRIRTDFGITTGLEVYIEKRIPISAGLGGGSSNAAVTFLALRKLYELAMDNSYMESTAAEFGSDINFFFQGGFAKGVSRGEIITPLPDEETLELLLVNPGFPVLSKEAYDLVSPSSIVRVEPTKWFNVLETGIRRKYKEIDNLLIALKSLGAAEAMMSGSGSTCLGLFEDKLRQSAALQYFNKQGTWCRLVKTVKREQYQECFQNLS